MMQIIALRHRRAHGFTLIEMSVVLVIIGLLTGGILLAQSLIRTSRVQTLITDVSSFQTAISQFRQKFSEIPGDMSDATNYWGINPNCSSGGAGTGTQTCNGNGNGRIGQNSANPQEPFLAWQHLGNAGFIPGVYTGAEYAAWPSTYYCSPTVNCPGGQINQTYFLAYAEGTWNNGSTSSYWAIPAGHYLVVGTSGFVGQAPSYPFVTASEAQTLDSKIDDGLPGTGVWRSYSANAGNIPNCVVNGSTGLALSDGTLTSEPLGVYNIAYGNKLACSFLIKLNF